MKSRSFNLLIVFSILLSLLGSAVTFSPVYAATTSVTIFGDMQSEAGCASDWDAACATTHLTYDATDDIWQGTLTLPTGSYAYKAAINDSPTENYGAYAKENGNNISLDLGSSTPVKFYYDDKSHWVTENINSVIAVTAGSFQSELGCPGDWQPDCLRSWLQDPDEDRIYIFSTDDIPAGDYEAKIAINENWTESYGADGVFDGSNIAFSVPTDGLIVIFAYDAATHITTIQLENPQPGPDFIVNNNGDYTNGFCTETDCTLREAINAANADANTSAITFDANYTIDLDDYFLGELPIITSQVSITGPAIIQAEPFLFSASSRVFDIASSGELTLDSLTVSNGACFYGSCAVSGNNGGGILNQGALTIKNSTISGNRMYYSGGAANANGGGVYNSGTLTVINSTFSNNSSTFYYSEAAYGGALANYGTATIINSTFSEGGANYGDSIYNAGTLNLQNSILNNSINNAGTCFNESGGTVSSSSSNNLIDDASNACGLTNGVNGNIIGSDPKLGALADNGGPTQTHALQSGSPAINAGNNVICAAAPINNLDQRGVTRDSACDIGAYEAQDKAVTSQGSNDGWILESAETSNKGGSLNKNASTLNLGDDAANKQYRAILSFNTSALPENAEITNITLSLKKAGFINGNPLTSFKGFMVDVKKGNFNKASLQLADFNKAASKTFGPFIPAIITEGWFSGWYHIDLSNAANYIKTDGNTQIRLRLKMDDNNNLKANILKLYSGNAAAANRPQLIVEYFIP